MFLVYDEYENEVYFIGNAVDLRKEAKEYYDSHFDMESDYDPKWKPKNISETLDFFQS